MTEQTAITIPERSLVVLIGPSGCGKSTFARQHFLASEVVSSDACRAMLSDDENDQSATGDAFDLLHYIVGKRLARGKLTVVDATNVQPDARKPLLALAKEHDVLPVAIVLDIPERVCRERNAQRPDRNFGAHVLPRQFAQFRRAVPALRREGFRYIHTLHSPEEIERVVITRQPLWNDRRELTGPFDIIGDIHGCADELGELLTTLGYSVNGDSAIPPEGRTAIFLGDLVDRGPATPDVLRLVMGMVAAGHALCIPGNHDSKLSRALRGRKVTVAHGLQESLDQLANEPPEFRDEVATFLDGLISHYVLDGGKLVVAHAGMKERYQGRSSGRVRDFALYGETTGETDEFGLPVRHNWAAEYRGKATVVYGHTPVPAAEWLNRTINIDTGCVFGGALTALRYPELELLSVPALREYAAPVRPFLPDEAAPQLTAQQQHDELLDLADVSGKRYIQTRSGRTVTIEAENAAAALEVMSRFAADPRWLIYLPPTMSPVETSSEPGLLEHPAEAFAYYQKQGVERVVCEEKHMGSRAIVVLCRDADAARDRFGVTTGEAGIVYTRTGRRFFDDVTLEATLLDRLRAAFDAAGFWDTFETNWALLDCELMPWSAKAQELLQHQYAAVGAATRHALGDTIAVLERATARGLEVDELLATQRERAELAGLYVDAYRRYCWPVASLDDLKLAPFHLLATEGRVQTDRDHAWQMTTLAAICAHDPGLLLATTWHEVDLADSASRDAATAWWTDLTERGGEGMVVKPLQFVAQDRRGPIQPAVKVRGRDYLRIIYGPEYTRPKNLERLRNRGLGAKRSLALREFTLGLEALDRFVRNEPLRRVHECVFGVLALESEPVDPRL
ncbi:MAG TPA: polynucleotide kinase-phosphatase [Thermomicrobiales bacterium]|nr:polynucleotide kinase-phosphatase [Thermomicrobiales bacterium]